MIQLPNIITLLRIAGSLGLLLCDVTGVVYWIIYGLCGISDIVDGWLARKLKCVTETGALLDSVADICFVACCAWKLLPILDLPQWLWLWAGVIVAIKIANQLSALVVYGRWLPSHHGKQSNGIPALYCCPYDIGFAFVRHDLAIFERVRMALAAPSVLVYRPHRHCGCHRHICRHTRGILYKDKK